jgi:hypothetical protein
MMVDQYSMASEDRIGFLWSSSAIVSDASVVALGVEECCRRVPHLILSALTEAPHQLISS